MFFNLTQFVILKKIISLGLGTVRSERVKEFEKTIVTDSGRSVQASVKTVNWSESYQFRIIISFRLLGMPLNSTAAQFLLQQ